MSPLIDMVFILLIFFIVTSVFIETPGIEVDKPRAASSTQLSKESILFALTAEGQIFYGGSEIGRQGIRSIVKRLCHKSPLPVVFEVDKQTDGGLIVRAIDEAKLAGAAKVSLATANVAR